MKHTLTLTCIALLTAVTLGQAAGDKGWFGFALNVDVDGFFNPTLRSIKIEKVLPASPAARARLAAGDIILEIEGHQVAGAKANDLKPVMEKAVGETLRLKIKRGDTTLPEVTLTAAKKP